MGPKITISRFVGLVFLVAALSSGPANAMSTEGTTPQGLKADGLRLQGIADRYVQMSGYTQDGLRADGLRYQAMARAYANRPAASPVQPGQTPQHKADPHTPANPQPQISSNAYRSNGTSQHSAIRPSSTRNTPTVSQLIGRPSRSATPPASCTTRSPIRAAP